MPGHDHAPHDDGGRGDRHHAGIGVAHAALDIHGAVLTEGRARPAGLGVDGDDAAVQGAFDDLGGAGLGRLGVGAGMIGHAAAGGRIGDVLVRDLGIIGPFLLAGRGVQREQLVARGAEIDGVPDLQRRGLGAPTLLRQIAGAEGPGAFQPADIVLVDLRQRGIALGAVGAAPGGPVGAGFQQGRIIIGAARSGQPVLDAGLVGLGDCKPEHHGQNRQPQGAAPGQTPAAVRLQHRQGRQNQDHQDQRPHQPGHQGPAVQTRLPQGPHEGEEEGRAIDPHAPDEDPADQKNQNTQEEGQPPTPSARRGPSRHGGSLEKLEWKANDREPGRFRQRLETPETCFPNPTDSAICCLEFRHIRMPIAT